MSSALRGLKKNNYNNRIYDRFQTELNGRLLDLNDIDERQIVVDDISLTGLGISSYTPTQVGTRIKLWIDATDNKREVFVDGTVSWLKEDKQKGWQMGVEVSNLSPFQYQRLWRRNSTIENRK